METPDDLRIGELYGFRQFQHREGKLRGVVKSNTAFQVGQNTAICLHDPRAWRHKAPALGCSCGIYAFYGDDEDIYAGDPATVGGIVAAWGTVIEGTLGFRAEHAELVALVQPPSAKQRAYREAEAAGAWAAGPFSFAVRTAVALSALFAVLAILALSHLAPAVGKDLYLPIGVLVGAAVWPLAKACETWLHQAAMGPVPIDRVAARYGVPVFETRAEAEAAFPLSRRPQASTH